LQEKEVVIMELLAIRRFFVIVLLLARGVA